VVPKKDWKIYKIKMAILKSRELKQKKGEKKIVSGYKGGVGHGKRRGKKYDAPWGKKNQGAV